ncbi:MAG: MbcA/ParS/Xre antitoxin family protein [Nitrospirota bacterium]|nr:MbcA/ParS/Xre antitoxin family protein [Nitrospirota bacterium]MDP3597930.1 MbcA/ParS/Xre antitoxin family protein [Nitrospirota bacterium]
MPILRISITAKQHLALKRNITRAEKGSIASEIQRAITQYLAGSKQIEAAFLTVLKDNAPKGLPDLTTLQAKLKKTNAQIDRTLARVKASERRMAALDRVDTAAVGLLALDAFGSADKAYAWLQRPQKALGQRTPFSLLTGASGFTRVETLLKRRTHAVPRHEGSSR